jgi:hypothetical protein
MNIKSAKGKVKEAGKEIIKASSYEDASNKRKYYFNNIKKKLNVMWYFNSYCFHYCVTR